jgi:TPR repeat protein
MSPAENPAAEHRPPGIGTWLAALFGSAEAQFSVAVHCWYRRRDSAAMHWARKAARTIPLAKVFLANLLTGQRPTDPAAAAEAVALVREAAEGGCAEAQQTLAAYYFNGQGVPRDVAECHRWCLKAAQGGRLESWVALLEYHLDGKHSEPDVTQALHYARLAAEAGHPEFLHALEIDLQNEKVLGPREPQDGTPPIRDR